MNITPPYLTDDEIREIVQPLTQPAAIVRWFRANGYPDCRVKPNRYPLIPRPAPGAGTPKPPEEAQGEAPDVTALLARFGKSAKSKAVSR